jgi:hypothetical protein
MCFREQIIVRVLTRVMKGTKDMITKRPNAETVVEENVKNIKIGVI